MVLISDCTVNRLFISPEVMIIDEIGRRKEVEAASTVKERGVSIIGSAHGDFASLLRNSELKRLLGGSQSVLLGDAAAKAENKGNKVGEREPKAFGGICFVVWWRCRAGWMG